MQDIVAILIALGAGAFLARRAWRQYAQRKPGSCGACSNCPSGPSTNPSTLVTISPIVSHAKAPRREDSAK